MSYTKPQVAAIQKRIKADGREYFTYEKFRRYVVEKFDVIEVAPGTKAMHVFLVKMSTYYGIRAIRVGSGYSAKRVAEAFARNHLKKLQDEWNSWHRRLNQDTGLVIYRWCDPADKHTRPTVIGMSKFSTYIDRYGRAAGDGHGNRHSVAHALPRAAYNANLLGNTGTPVAAMLADEHSRHGIAVELINHN